MSRPRDGAEPRARRARRPFAAALFALALATTPAGAQPSAPSISRGVAPAPDLRTPVTGLALPGVSRLGEPLPGGSLMRLQRAVDLRSSGLADRARDSLLVLLRLHPHHPLVVTELGRTHAAREDWGALERLAVAERMARRDSTLLGPELVMAYERTSRPREAIRAAVAAWTSSPADGAWAMGTFFRLAAVEPRFALSTLDEVAAPRPWRSDLTVGLARLHSMAGRPADAVRVLHDAEQRSGRAGLRVLFADEALRSGRASDTTAAIAVLTDLAGDHDRRPDERLAAARRAWSLALGTGSESDAAEPLSRALRDVPGERWGPEFLIGVVRALQRGGHVAEVRTLLAANPGIERRMPELALERGLAFVREGDLGRGVPLLDSLAGTWPAARFMLAEVQFFSGELDSAHANYERVAARPDDPDAAAALERLYLLEEHPGSETLRRLGRIAHARWSGDRTAATRLADSLWRSQAPQGEYAAEAGIALAELRMEAGDARGALVPLLVIADSLVDDRMAPLARQRAGEAYTALGDDPHALAQYEECLARYPRAWNAAEVRRRLERLRRTRS